LLSRQVFAIAFAGVAAASRGGIADDRPHLPGIRAHDGRVVVDVDRPPWNAVAKVQTNIGSRCTGVLVAPAVVLTAAHCLYNPRTRALLQPVSLHVLLGFQRDSFRWHRLVASYSIGRGFDGQKSAPRTSDWARIELAEPVPGAIRPLTIAAQPAYSGLPVMLAGYNQDRSQLLMADEDCHVGIVTPQAGGTLLLHDCSATRGTSGGPLLAREGAGWAVVGINIGGGDLANLALAAPFGEAERSAR
jgi:protease YdgD